MFEAGTGSIADTVGLGAAIDYLGKIGMENVARHEHGLIAYATKVLSDVPGSQIIGTAAEKAGVLSFGLQGQETEAVGSALNQEGIAVRAGHHCAQPILRRFGLESTVAHRLRFIIPMGIPIPWPRPCARIQSGHNRLGRSGTPGQGMNLSRGTSQSGALRGGARYLSGSNTGGFQSGTMARVHTRVS